MPAHAHAQRAVGMQCVLRREDDGPQRLIVVPSRLRKRVLQTPRVTYCMSRAPRHTPRPAQARRTSRRVEPLRLPDSRKSVLGLYSGAALSGVVCSLATSPARYVERVTAILGRMAAS